MEKNDLKLPVEFVQRLKTQLGEYFKKYEEAIKEPAVRGLRVNTKRIRTDDFEKLSGLSLESVPFEENGFVLKSAEKLGNTFFHQSGLFYLQEPSSMLAVAASEIEKENPQRVLDLCAAPGGKTGQIACKTNEDAIVFSNEIVSSRVGALYSNVERQGFENVIVLNEKPENLLVFENHFDMVFVDAPCSGEGMFRKNPETISEWSKENVEMCKARQQQILKVAEKLVKAGGKLIYSTCTFSEEEDEQIVEWFLRNFNFEICEVKKSILGTTESCNLPGKNGECARKFFPFSGNGEGQFVAVFKNLDEEESRPEKMYARKHNKSVFEVGRSEKEIFKTWAKQNLQESFAEKLFDGKLIKVGDSLYALPKSLSDEEISMLDGLRFESLGVKLGHYEKGRFEPDHAMFMAFYKYFKIVADLDETLAAKYVHGEQINYSFVGKGYAAVTFSGYPLGGAKLSDGKLKNLLPKGLRV